MHVRACAHTQTHTRALLEQERKKKMEEGSSAKLSFCTKLSPTKAQTDSRFSGLHMCFLLMALSGNNNWTETVTSDAAEMDGKEEQ